MLSINSLFLIYFTFLLNFALCEVPLPNNVSIFKATNITGRFRLASESIPSHYKLTLITKNMQEEEYEYTGTVEINITALMTTSTIRLHNRDLEITNATLKQGTLDIPVQSFDTDSNYEYLDIITQPPNVLSIGGEYLLTIEFNGILKDANQGFFRSYYDDNNGNRVRLAATQFEPTHARSAFPCYDEPGLKATFALTIKHWKSQHVIANMIGVRRDDESDPNYAITEFATTDLPMSTYLLAFAISDFDSDSYYPTQSSDPQTNLTIYARPNAIDLTDTASDFSVKVLDELEKYIGVSYSYKHMQQIAIPDFAGAMENWALVTYKEENLIFDKNSGTIDQLNQMKLTIAHELAHQWFGNLVTCQWWNFNWLNEGFATLFEYMAQDMVAPDEHFYDRIIVESLHTSMILDGAASTRAMTTDAETPLGISSLFDGIAYDKGGSVLRMFRHTMGEEIFKIAINKFITDNAEKAVFDTQLFNAFTSAIGDTMSNVEPIKFFNSWTTQKGYPVLTAIRDYYNNKINIIQNRFLYNFELLDTTYYYIPLNVAGLTESTSYDDTSVEYWIPGNSSIVIDIADNENYYIINKQQTGYYRVNYDETNWNRIIDHLQNESTPEAEKIHPNNRAQLIDDVFNLARAGEVPYELALNLSYYLTNEKDYLPWAAADANLKFLFRMLINPVSDHTFKFTHHIYNLIMPLYNELGFDHNSGDSAVVKELRNIIVDWFCTINRSTNTSQQCSSIAVDKLTDYFVNNVEIDPNSKSIVYCIGLRYEMQNTDHFDKLWEKFQLSLNQAERGLIIDSFGCADNYELLYDMLEKTASESKTYSGFRKAERNRVFDSILKNHNPYNSESGAKVAIEYVSNNFVYIQQHYNNAKALQNAVLSIAKYIKNDEKDLFEGLLSKLSSTLDESIIVSARETAEEVTKWHDKYREGVFKWLEDRYVDSAKSHMISITLLIISFVLVRLF